MSYILFMAGLFVLLTVLIGGISWFVAWWLFGRGKGRPRL